MALRTASQYLEGLRDGRRVYYRGRRVDDVTTEPDFRASIGHCSLDFELAEDPELHDLAVAKDPDGEDMSAFFRIPRSAEHLADRSKLIGALTTAGGTMVTLVKEIGTDALFGLLSVLEGEELGRVEAYLRRCQKEDLTLAVAQTDVKGNRSLPPHQQPDPDLYVHVVDERDDGIVVRGAKCHTTASVNSDEVIVLPTRAMGPDDADYAVAFATPIDTEGLTLYVSPYSAGVYDSFEHPASSDHVMLDTLTVFDDVFVPWERVFSYRQPELSGPIALGFVEYHRFTAISYKLPLLDALVGATGLITEMNGVAKAGHIRDKLTRLIGYAETIRALTEMAALRAHVDDRDIAHPDPLTTNLTKFTFASRFHEALEWVQDCAGGLLVTGPGGDDWASPEVRPVLEKYFAGVAPAEDRLRVMNLIADLTVREFGGYHTIVAIHAEGSIEAEKMQILRSYDPGPALAYARRLAGIDQAS